MDSRGARWELGSNIYVLLGTVGIFRNMNVSSHRFQEGFLVNSVDNYRYRTGTLCCVIVRNCCRCVRGKYSFLINAIWWKRKEGKCERKRKEDEEDRGKQQWVKWLGGESEDFKIVFAVNKLQLGSGPVEKWR